MPAAKKNGSGISLSPQLSEATLLVAATGLRQPSFKRSASKAPGVQAVERPAAPTDSAVCDAAEYESSDLSEPEEDADMPSAHVLVSMGFKFKLAGGPKKREGPGGGEQGARNGSGIPTNRAQLAIRGIRSRGRTRSERR